jgi:hypothetical protein
VEACLDNRTSQKELGKFKKKLFTSLGLEPVVFRLVVQCLNHYVTACTGPNFMFEVAGSIPDIIGAFI